MWPTSVPIDRSLLKGEAPRFSADFTHPLSSERPSKSQHQLIQYLEYDELISNCCTLLTSANDLFLSPRPTFPIPPTHRLDSSPNSSMNFFKSALCFLSSGSGATSVCHCWDLQHTSKVLYRFAIATIQCRMDTLAKQPIMLP
jgi:hypothetical protein